MVTAPSLFKNELSMLKTLGVTRTTVQHQVDKHPVKLSETNEECYFCNNNSSWNDYKRHRQITQEDIELVKKQCGEHSKPAMARFLNVGIKTFTRRISAEKIVFFCNIYKLM